MARSEFVTLIPLDRFAKLLQIDPLHFNGVVSARRPVRNDCDDIFFQHDYQFVGRTSRDAIALALIQAERRVNKILGYPLKPTWIADEPQPITKLANPDLLGFGSLNVEAQSKSVTAAWGWIVSAGRRATEIISLAAPIVYSDADLDGYFETATVVVPTTVIDAQEVGVYYPGKAGAVAWEIRPAQVSISGGNATIVFRREQAVLEAKLEELTDLTDAPPSIDGDDNTNFLTTVDVFREYNDPSVQAIFVSESSCPSCGGAGCQACGFDVESGCLRVRDPRLGILAYERADWDAVTETYSAAAFIQGREPDRIRLWYRAGWQDTSLEQPLKQMDPIFERMVSYYAMTLLDSDIPGCANTRKITQYYQYDLAATKAVGNQASSNQVAPEDLRNPLGTTRAAMQLWKYIHSGDVQLGNAR